MILIYKDRIIFINKNNQFHRVDGPAVIHVNGTKSWYQNGKRHRENRPAIINSDGRKTWFINNKQYTEGDYYIKIAEMDN